MATRKDFDNRLTAWFSNIPFNVQHTWFEPSADAPTLFAVVASVGDILYMRVHNTSGRLQVHCDKRTPIKDI